MASQRPQAISGVNTGDGHVMSVFPGNGNSAIGRLLGQLYECIPVRIFGVKLSNLLFTLPTAPLAVGLYGWQKVTGTRYDLTTEAVEIWSVIGKRRLGRVALGDIASVDVVTRPGQQFYKASDLRLKNAAGDALMTLGGIPRAEIFRETILKAAEARREVEASLATITARQSA